MASVLDQRNILVQHFIPKLIKNLTGFSVSERIFSLLALIHNFAFLRLFDRQATKTSTNV